MVDVLGRVVEGRVVLDKAVVVDVVVSRFVEAYSILDMGRMVALVLEIKIKNNC